MSQRHYVACDLGADSGRVILGTLENGKLTLEEIHRFPTGALPVRDTLRWNILRIYEEIKTGLRLVAKRNLKISGVSTDSWGVDYVHLFGNEPFLTAPYHYRDSRTDKGFEQAFAVVPKAEIFQQTGIQFMTLNTLYQLHADLRERPRILEQSEQFLNIADYFNFLFSNVKAVEESMASTTQLYNPTSHTWARPLIEQLGLPYRIFPTVVPSATVLGPVAPSLAAELNWQETKVVATCSHDTGAAVAAVPGEGNDWAYLSSGTWSLLGIESPTPIINAESLEKNFTNEIGVGGSIRFLKNIVGLWMVQESRRTWMLAGDKYSFEELSHLATEAPSLRSLINPTSSRFAKPNDMPRKVADYCRETGQPVPETPGQVIRAIYESLALLYSLTIDNLEKLSGRKINRLHIVGGGAKDKLLNQFTANATGRPVFAGPMECTAVGNLLIQALALGDIKTHADLRTIVRNTFPLEPFKPENESVFAEARRRFAALPVLD